AGGTQVPPHARPLVPRRGGAARRGRPREWLADRLRRSQARRRSAGRAARSLSAQRGRRPRQPHLGDARGLALGPPRPQRAAALPRDGRGDMLVALPLLRAGAVKRAVATIVVIAAALFALFRYSDFESAFG